MEREKSCKSDFELKDIQEKKRMQNEEVKKNAKDVNLLTIQELEDKYNEELQHFKNNYRYKSQSQFFSRLDEKLFLVTQQSLGQSQNLIFPMKPWEPNETLLETSQKAFKIHTKTSFLPIYTSNAPIGFYKYKYPKPVSLATNYDGAKVFFYMTYLEPRKRHVFQQDQTHLKWLTKSEMKDQLKSAYYNSISKFLLA